MSWSGAAESEGQSGDRGMPAQQSLFDLPQSRFDDRLFFALFPNPASLPAIVREQQQVLGRFGARCTPHRPERLHVTLVHVDDFESLPSGVVEASRRVADGLRQAPVDVSFDLLASFNAHSTRPPCVLRGADGASPGLMAFQQTLARSLLKAGIKHRTGKSFTPHVTLLYSDRGLPNQAVAPIGWVADEFVLVHSRIGKGVYNILGRWPLRA